LLGLAHIGWLRVVIGGTFDWVDILCYGVGCAAAGAAEHLWRKTHGSGDSAAPGLTAG